VGIRQREALYANVQARAAAAVPAGRREGLLDKRPQQNRRDDHRPAGARVRAALSVGLEEPLERPAHSKMSHSSRSPSSAIGRYRVFLNVGCLAVQVERLQLGSEIGEASDRRRPIAALRASFLNVCKM